jgi:hypothetical protein
VLLLGSLVLSDDFYVFWGLVEAFANDSTHIIELVVAGPRSPVQVGFGILELLVYVLVDLLGLVVVSFGQSPLVANFHKLARRTIEVRLHLLELTTLAEQVLGGSSALVLEDLLAVQVSSFGPLHEFIPIVLVPELQVVECVDQGLQLLLTLPNLAIKLVTIPLQLFFLLRSLNHIISL